MDPRAHSMVRLAPPSPLPYVSRRALKRVTNPLPTPTECRYCHGNVVLTANDVIYGNTYGDWPYVYLCKQCDAYVGLHPATDIPLGTLANKALRRKRLQTKGAFYAYLQNAKLTRDAGYKWLSARTGIPPAECHFGHFDIEECDAIRTLLLDQLRPEHIHN